MIYDQIVGEIGVFEILEYVGIAAIYAALFVIFPPRPRHRPTADVTTAQQAEPGRPAN